MNETQEFTLLTDFIEAFEPLVEPRAAAPLTDDERQLLAKIANGASSNDDRDRALSLLSDNSTAMEFLALKLKEA